MSISTQAMIVNLHMGFWQGYRLDKEASRKVVDEANAEADAARVNKHLVPKEALKDVVTAAGVIRNHFYSNTLPWKDNGDRLLTRKLFTKFMDEHGELVRKFNEAVEDFLDNKYPTAVAKAEFRMGELFKLDDYPRRDELAPKFYAYVDIDAVAEAGDFRVQMGQEETERCVSQMQQAMSDRLAKAAQDVWTRLFDSLEKFAEKTGDEKARLYEAHVTNLEEIVEMLPALNIMGDSRLDDLYNELRQRVCGHDVKDLRKNEATRAAVAKEAQDIMDTMKGFMAAFGAGDE